MPTSFFFVSPDIHVEHISEDIIVRSRLHSEYE